MGRKSKNTTFEQRQLCIFHHAKGRKYTEIAEIVNIPKSTVGDIIRRTAEKQSPTKVKHGGGSVLVWGCISAAGVEELVFIDGIMDRKQYLRILKGHLQRSAEKLGIQDTFKYYQDSDPRHKAYDVWSWLLFNCPKVIQTPAQSPDLNPIENTRQQGACNTTFLSSGTEKKIKGRMGEN
ncbi:hypothetical protein ANN_24992 [Periplaneta americana]|uniref:Transposase n=1 Tax=Periplaneta americana TaxID=6978 RepID=A0ABQ8S0Q6_PERAM|nr:hypothetical protein ANN_24992 [Periplaneta americana]